MSQEIVEFDKWTWLPSDLLQEIGKYFESSKDYVRFCATCKSWNTSLPKIPNHIRGPLLVLPFNHKTYDTKEEKDFYLRLHKIHDNNILLRGSCFGWLIGIRINGAIQLLNPLADAKYDLPPMSTFPTIVDYHPQLKNNEYTIMLHYLDGSTYTTFIDKSNVRKMVTKIVLSPPTEEFMALAIYGEFRRLAWCKFGDAKWTDFSTPGAHKINLEDAIFYEGKVYAINYKAQLYIFDVTTLIGGITEVPRPEDLYISLDLNVKYLVHNVEGDLLMVSRFLNYDGVNGVHDYTAICYNTETFKVYKLDKSAKRWRRILSLGDCVLVVGYNSSVCMLPFSDGKGNWVRNCIYFTDDNFDSQYNEIACGHDVGIFNMESREVQKLFPNLKHLHPPPIWYFSKNSIC